MRRQSACCRQITIASGRRLRRTNTRPPRIGSRTLIVFLDGRGSKTGSCAPRAVESLSGSTTAVSGSWTKKSCMSCRLLGRTCFGSRSSVACASEGLGDRLRSTPARARSCGDSQHVGGKSLSQLLRSAGARSRSNAGRAAPRIAGAAAKARTRSAVPAVPARAGSD